MTVWVAFYEVVRFEFCHFEERERREILISTGKFPAPWGEIIKGFPSTIPRCLRRGCSLFVKIDRFLPSVEMTKMAVIQSSQDMNDPEEAFPAGNHSDIRIDQAPA